MTLFGKSRIALLSTLHGLLDKVIDLNSIGAVRQFIRDLEASLQEMSNSLAEARGNVTSITRDRDRLQGEMTRLDGQIDGILGDDDPSNDHLAATLQAKYNGDQQMLAVQEENLKTASATVGALEEVHSQLEAKHTAMMQQLSKLQVLEQSAHAKEAAAASISNAAAVAGEADGLSVDNVVEKIQHRSDVADQKLSMAMGKFGTSTERDVQLAGVAADIAARKLKLAAAKQTA